MQYNFEIYRKNKLHTDYGLPSTNIYNQVKDGTLPPPIPLGARAVGFLKHEIDAVMAARAAGLSKPEIKTLVKEIVERRKAEALNFIHQIKNT